MSTRVALTLDEDVINRVNDQSRASGRSFDETLNELIREGLCLA